MLQKQQMQQQLIQQNNINMDNQINQMTLQKNSNTLRFAIFVFGIILLIAIPLYSMLLGRIITPPKKAITQKALLAPLASPTPIPTIAPMAIVHRQDINDALKLIDGTDTSTVEKQLDQLNSTASSLNQ